MAGCFIGITLRFCQLFFNSLAAAFSFGFYLRAFLGGSDSLEVDTDSTLFPNTGLCVCEDDATAEVEAAFVWAGCAPDNGSLPPVLRR